MKIRRVGTEFFHADRRKERERHDEANSRLSQNCETRLKTSPMTIVLFVSRIGLQPSKIQTNDTYLSPNAQSYTCTPHQNAISQLTIIKPHSES